MPVSRKQKVYNSQNIYISLSNGTISPLYLYHFENADKSYLHYERLSFKIMCK